MLYCDVILITDFPRRMLNIGEYSMEKYITSLNMVKIVQYIYTVHTQILHCYTGTLKLSSTCMWYGFVFNKITNTPLSFWVTDMWNF